MSFLRRSDLFSVSASVVKFQHPEDFIICFYNEQYFSDTYIYTQIFTSIHLYINKSYTIISGNVILEILYYIDIIITLFGKNF